MLQDLFSPSEKQQSVYDYLTRIEYDFEEDDWDMLQTNQMIAEELSIPKIKVNQILLSIYEGILDALRRRPLNVQKYVHVIAIYIPSKEIAGSPNKSYGAEIDRKTTEVRLVLPVTPRVGELIDLDFIEESIGFKRGYVHEVTHNIRDSIQEIVIIVHPYKNEYERWKKLEKEYDLDELRRRRWRNT